MSASSEASRPSLRGLGLSKQRAARRASAAYPTFTARGLRNQEPRKVNHFILHALCLHREEGKFPPAHIFSGGGSGGGGGVVAEFAMVAKLA